jgi:hypothetical protein
LGAESSHGSKMGKGRGKRKRFILIFRKYFHEKNSLDVARSFIKATENILKTSKFQENSERHFETRAIQIKYLELMKKIFSAF